MGLKKYEIITVGSDRRVRALRSWQVGDRYVNIGDVGGIVYDEKTLSQDGACWLFRGNFGFPGARIGGDSIVDVAEAALSAAGAPNVDILGSSVVVGSKLHFVSDLTATDAVVLTANDFEQGGFNALIAGNPLTGSDSPTYIRTKNPIFAGGVPVTLKCSVPGYSVTAVALDRDGLVITSALATATGVGVTITVPAGQYFSIAMRKDLTGPTVPADATAAQITFTGTYETSLSIVDSRVEINPATSAALAILKPGGTHNMTSGAKYPEAIIRNSKVTMNASAAVNRTFRIRGQIIGSTATLDAATGDVTIAGQYSNVKNLMASGLLTTSTGEPLYNSIQVTNCDNFAVSPTIFPGFATAYAARVPFIFQGCNVPNGLFYHHAQIANTYKNIDFAKASVDLGKSVPGVTYTLVSSETEGMYRVYNTAANLLGFLVESYDSISSIGLLAATATSYGTTIYKDAYVSGKFDIAGTNVFGSKSPSHPLAQVLNVAPRVVNGNLNTSVVGSTITGIIPSANRVCIPTPIRINGANGLKVEGFSTTLEADVVIVTPSNVVVAVASSSSGTVPFPAARLNDYAAYVRFRKRNDSPITPEDLAGVTVTVYNGCKIVNTDATADNIKGNFRVEDNATLINCSLIGSGYFGGNAVASGLLVAGSAFMSDNASFTKTAGAGVIGNLKMKDNGVVVLGDVIGLGVLDVSENARLQPTNLFLSEADLIMSGNALVTAGLSLSGILRLKDNAKVAVSSMTAKGDITVCGSYSQTAMRRWVGKRVIDNENAPEYDNNVKTQYDF